LRTVLVTGASSAVKVRYLVGRDAKLRAVASVPDRLRDRVLERPCAARAPSDLKFAAKGGEMGYAFGSLDELGEGYGFRKVRAALGVTAFGVNVLVYPPDYEGFHHYHDTQDELYFVHRGKARVEVESEVRELGPGGLFHCESTTPRKVSNPGDEDLVLFIVGGKGGYVERDGHLVNMDDLPRRRAFGEGVVQ
jgi:mannose-6-phosphate isomerase-like protein (cupin superfamily)